MWNFIKRWKLDFFAVMLVSLVAISFYIFSNYGFTKEGKLIHKGTKDVSIPISTEDAENEGTIPILDYVFRNGSNDKIPSTIDQDSEDSETVETENNPSYCDTYYGTEVDHKYFYDNPDRPDQVICKKYLDEFIDLYSVGVLGNGQMWNVHGWKEDTYNFSKIDAVLDWQEQNGKRLEYHSIVWHNPKKVGIANDGFLDWYEDMPLQDRRIALKNHVRTVMERYIGRIDLYVVVNHPLNMGDQDDYMLTGWDVVTAVDKIFRWAEEVNPSAILIINENRILTEEKHFDPYFKLLGKLKTKGTPIDAVGIMGHIYEDHYDVPISTMDERINAIAALGFRVHITEFDLGVPDREGFDPNIAYHSYSSWWEYQAWFYGEMYSMFGTNQNIDYVLSWGFWDGDLWRRGAGLFDENWNRKPAYNTIKKFLHNEGCS